MEILGIHSYGSGEEWCNRTFIFRVYAWKFSTNKDKV